MSYKSTEDTSLLISVRYAALISATVTGKIDVRHWQEPEMNDED